MWPYGYSTLRSHQQLIDYLKGSNILKTQRIYEAMLATDRAHYAPSTSEPYSDTPQPIGHEATISAPHMHAHALEELASRLIPGNTVLDVGCGSGYFAACTARLVGVLEGKGTVWGIDIIPELVELAQRNTEHDNAALLKNGRLRYSLENAWTLKNDSNLLFDAIHVGAAADGLPEALLQNLAPNGVMIVPLGDSSSGQWIYRIRKDAQGKVVEQKKLLNVMYVPLVKALPARKR